MKGRYAMATVPAPRSDVYLSLLAAKALTALADLAGNPAAWDDGIKTGIESGIEYCEACRTVLSRRAAKTPNGPGFKRRAIDSGEIPSTISTPSECDRVKTLLSQILSGKRTAVMSELNEAIDFFSPNRG